MKHLKLFNLKSEYDSYKESSDFVKPNISFIKETGVEFVPNVDYSKQYLTFEALEDGLVLSLSKNKSYYKIDDGSWVSLTAGSSTPQINKGQKIAFKLSNPSISLGIGTFTTSVNCNVFGNIMSLLYEDEFKDKLEIPKTYCFYNLFKNCKIIDASNLALPATTLNNYCYSNLFRECASLLHSPQLPATTLALRCYGNMFLGCSALLETPKLPATTLADDCYAYMFRGCKALTKPQELPATQLKPSCYLYMFYQCSALTDSPLLPSMELADNCYQYMFGGCTALVNAPELPATVLAPSCYKHMFNSCFSLTTTPALPATTLAAYCYSDMFYNCTGLITASELPALDLVTGCYEHMFESCTNLNYIKMLATDISAENCLYSWVSKVLPYNGIFVKNEMTNLPLGENGIPTYWTVENFVIEVPEVPQDIFNGHEYVDLGLPSGTLWATMNVGSNSPETIGTHYAWGETEDKATFNAAQCKAYGLSISDLQNQGIIDDSKNLTRAYDAVSKNWGGEWRMPTRIEVDELLSNCTLEVLNAYEDQLQRIVFTGPNGNLITIPNTYYAQDNSLVSGNGINMIWAATASENSGKSYMLNNNMCVATTRSYGFNVRGVINPNN